MDPLAMGVIVFIAVLVGLAVISGRASRGKLLSEFGVRERSVTSAPPSASELEHQDLAEMLEVTNARRRTRGLPERGMSDAIREFESE